MPEFTWAAGLGPGVCATVIQAVSATVRVRRNPNSFFIIPRLVESRILIVYASVLEFVAKISIIQSRIMDVRMIG